MDAYNVNAENIIFALDIGTRSVIGTVGIVQDKKFKVVCEHYVEHEERAMIDGQIHDIALVANAVKIVKKALEEQLGFSLNNVAIAAAGRFLRTTTLTYEAELEYDKNIDMQLIRSLEASAVKRAEEDIALKTEGKLYCVGYSVKNYYLNGYIIGNLLSQKGEKAAVEVIATFLPRSVVDSLYEVVEKAKLNVVSLTLEPIAAMEAAVPKNLRLLNLALVDIGAGTSDIAISSKDSISAYGMVPIAGDEVTEVIAQNLLIDFNTAERVKREVSISESVCYTDVLGLQNEIKSEDVIKFIIQVVDKIASEICKNVIESNGGKAPNAVFLVGGGAHTPKLKELIAEKLGILPQRVAIKDRSGVIDCECMDNNLGSVGITVLGIALVSIKKNGHDFINVTLNDSVVSLFNSKRHNVMDVMLQNGINPKLLLGKNGKNIRFTLNNTKRVAFGALASSAKITINDINADIDSEVHEGDNIEITFAKDGKDASPRVLEFIQKLNYVSFYLNGSLRTMEPLCFINDKRSNLDDGINEGDNVAVIYPATLGEFLKYYEYDNKELKFSVDSRNLDNSYVIKEGDEIECGLKEKENVVYDSAAPHKEEPRSIQPSKTKEAQNEIEIFVNDSIVKLRGKDKYIFIDIFNFIEFDLTRVQGNLILNLNDKNAGYYDVLSPGDKVKISWNK